MALDFIVLFNLHLTRTLSAYRTVEKHVYVGLD